MIAHATPLRDRVSTEDARAELGKFFQLADMAEQSPGMFSKFIDAEWHRLAETADYNDFCKTAVGRIVTHLPINGEGEVTWLGLYHGRFGTLPAAWFADADGAVDSDAYWRYLATRKVSACWNCAPDTGDPDYRSNTGQPSMPDHGTAD